MSQFCGELSQLEQLDLECRYVDQLIDIITTAPKELWKGILVTFTYWVKAELGED